MSEFQVQVMRIDSVEDHPDADRLSLNRIRGFVAISNKEVDHAQGESEVNFVHRYRAGDLVIYVPEGAVVPDRLLQRFGYWDEDKQKGILAGSKGNRVKAVKLRGIISQGLIFPATYMGKESDPKLGPGAMFEGICAQNTFEEEVLDEPGTFFTQTTREGADLFAFEGDNVANYLGIIKYEPEVPAAMDGQLTYTPEYVVKFDIENAQKYPTIFENGESVIATEKLHGTFTGLVFTQNTVEGFDRIDMAGMDISYSAFSKGCGAKGFTFAMTHDNVLKNVYCKQAVNLAYTKELQRSLCRYFFHNEGGIEFIAILGETYGKGIQDLDYSLPNAQFAAFSIVVKEIDGRQRYLNFEEVVRFAKEANIPLVPILYVGPYDEFTLTELRDGKSAIDNKTIREGIVIVPAEEGRNDEIGRRVLKMVSPDYLTRKNATEYN